MSLVFTKGPACLFDTSWTIYGVSPDLNLSGQYRDLLRNQNALLALGRDLKRFFEGKKRQIHEYGDSDSEHVGGLDRVEITQITSSATDEPNERLYHQGILITLIYERGSYKAAFFRGTKFNSRYEDDRIQLPALLLRMPAHLSKRLIDFLCSNFKVAATPIKIATTVLYNMLGNYLNTLSMASKDRSDDVADDLYSTVLKDLKFCFAFGNPVSPQLRLLDVNVPNSVLCQSMSRTVQMRKSGRASGDTPKDIIEELAAFFDRHTGLQIPRPSQKDESDLIKVSKLACGAFVLAADGKFKLVSKAIDALSGEAYMQAAKQANEQLLNEIVEVAAGLEG